LPDALERFTEETEETREKTQKAEGEREQREKQEKESEENLLTPEQRTEIDRLIATLVDKYGSYPDEIRLVMKNKFSIELISEAKKDQANSAIAYLKHAIEIKEKQRKK